jgi:hypothetical protein
LARVNVILVSLDFGVYRRIERTLAISCALFRSHFVVQLHNESGARFKWRWVSASFVLEIFERLLIADFETRATKN